MTIEEQEIEIEKLQEYIRNGRVCKNLAYVSSSNFREDLRIVFEHESGKRVLNALRVYFGVDLPVFKPIKNRTLENATEDALLCEGQRRVIIWIEENLNYAYE